MSDCLREKRLSCPWPRIENRTYADGYIERIRAALCVLKPPPYKELCITWGLDEPDTWEPVPGPMMELRK